VKKTALSGIKPTGSLHIANYLGMIKHYNKIMDGAIENLGIRGPVPYRVDDTSSRDIFTALLGAEEVAQRLRTEQAIRSEILKENERREQERLRKELRKQKVKDRADWRF